MLTRAKEWTGLLAIAACLRVAAATAQQADAASVDLLMDFGNLETEATFTWRRLTSAGVLAVVHEDEARVRGLVRIRRPWKQETLLTIAVRGQSPFTVATREVDERPVTVPRSVGRAEVLLYSRRGDGRPVAVVIDGTRRVDVDRAGLAVISELEPGGHEVQTLYAGGLNGPIRRVNGIANQLTVVALESETPGQVRVLLDDRQTCAEVTVVSLISVESIPGGHAARLEVARDGPSDRCEWLFEGVPSGSYELHAESPAGTLAFAGTQIAAGRISVVRLQLSAVSVSGIVRVNGAPVPDVSLLFISDDAPAPVAVSTDALGIYSVRLATAGKYLVSFRHSHAVFEPLEVTLVLGENVVDHDVSGGAATIKLDGWNQQSPVVVRFRSKRGRRDVVVSPGQAAEHTVTALPLGSYEVTAFQDGGWATRQPEFVMIEDNSDQPSIELRLELNGAMLVLVGPDGGRVAGADVRLYLPGEFISTTPPAVESAPGAYELNGAMLGMVVRVRPLRPYVPTCMVLSQRGLVERLVSVGSRAELLWPDAAGLNAPVDARVLGIVGADCPVPLTDFRPVRIQVGPGGAPVYEVASFPASPVTVATRSGKHVAVRR